jgi:hypothetical protein
MNTPVKLKPNEEIDLMPEQRPSDSLWLVCVRNDETGKVIKEYTFKTEEQANDFIDQVIEDNDIE